MNKKVAIIIVNWNGRLFLQDCLSSVYAQTYSNIEVYFIDNGSTDDSVSLVRENFPQTHVLLHEFNMGFAYANNIGINEAFKDNEVQYIFTLNNDTVIDKNSVSNLVIAIEKDENISSIAPKVKFLNDSTVIDSVGLVISEDGGGMNRGHKEKNISQYEIPSEIFGVCAGAALYSRTALEDVNYDNQFFDNSFFAYYEDLDLAWRLRLRGWKSWYCPDANVLHVHSGTSIMYSPFKAYYVNRNRLFLIVKNLPARYLIKAFCLTPYRYLKLINSMIFAKSGPSYELKKKTNFVIPFLLVLKGWGSFLIQLPSLLLKRHKIQSQRKASREDVVSWFKSYSVSLHDMIYK